MSTATLAAGTKLSITTDGGTTYTQILGIKSPGVPTATASEVKVTPLEETDTERYISGLKDGDSSAISVYRDIADDGQNALKTAAIAKDNVGLKLELPTGEVATFDVALKGWNLEEPEGSSAVSYQVPFKLSGAVTWA